jgi:hypothetical protein
LRGNSQHLGCLLNAQPSKESELNHLRFARVYYH